jgi:hypothetical protein
MRKRRAMILVSLVDESSERTCDEIEREILRELSAASIPWCKKIESVKVLED